jgi:hypothetical protein
MPLTDTSIRNAKPRKTPFKLSDGGGLHLLVQPQGSRLWRLAYRFAGKQKTLALGVYPTVSLAKAREGRDSAKRLLADGKDPGVQKRRDKLAAKAAGDATCVHPTLLTAAGLYAFRYIAAFYYSTTDVAGADEQAAEPSPLKAVVWLLNVIADRLAGADGAWLNSLKLVAERIIGDAYGYGTVSERLYARRSPPRYVAREG